MNLQKKLLEKIKRVIQRTTRFFKLLPSYLFSAHNNQKQAVYVVDNANWSIKWDGIHITENLTKTGRNSWVDASPSLYKNKIIHFGSSYVFEQFSSKLNSNNKYFVNFFHGKFGDDPVLDRRYNLLKKHIDNIDGVIYSTSIMKERFLEFGIPKEKLFYVPIGVDLKSFKPASKEFIKSTRKSLGIPEDAFVIGSFQKDGDGWGEGMSPKLIKGPDTFIEMAKQINQKRPVFCLLSGPARGFVKKGLEDANVPFLHEYFENYFDVIPFYQILDAYIITSREEGGPKALLEAMACGVPVVTTDVGMARDVIDGHDCGVVCDVDDISALISSTLEITDNDEIQNRLVKNGLKRIQAFDWPEISKYCEDAYNSVDRP